MHRKRKNKKYLKSLLLVIIVIGVVFISYNEVLNNKNVNIYVYENSKTILFEKI